MAISTYLGRDTDHISTKLVRSHPLGSGCPPSKSGLKKNVRIESRVQPKDGSMRSKPRENAHFRTRLIKRGSRESRMASARNRCTCCFAIRLQTVCVVFVCVYVCICPCGYKRVLSCVNVFIYIYIYIYTRVTNGECPK